MYKDNIIPSYFYKCIFMPREVKTVHVFDYQLTAPAILSRAIIKDMDEPFT